MKSVIEILQRTNEIEQLLRYDEYPVKGFPNIKSFHNHNDFLEWKEETILELQKLKQEQLVVEIIELLKTGFDNGFSDASNFKKLKAKISILLKNIDDYVEDEGVAVTTSMRMRKNTVINTAFDNYKLIEQVGSGGNGRVFSAETSDGEKVAIKFVERNISTNKLKRFKNEINFCEQHTHKNIVRVLDRGHAFLDDKEYVFYVMPLYTETLKDKIKTGVPHDKVIEIFVGLVEGVKFAHEHGSIHRDIKPENIMFAENSWEPVICDFGIAHFSEDDLITIIETKATDRMANFQYAAPEQRQRGGNVCFQTDIYALALILNEMFTGEIPQANGYKTIEEINADYAYLDKVFDHLYKQAPEERLYPEDKILSEIKILAEQDKREQEKLKLQETIISVTMPEGYDGSIENKRYENGKLIFTFDKPFPSEWFNMLAYGSYDSSWMMGYEKENLKAIGVNEIYMPLRGNESQEIIKSIVGHIQSWVKTINREYTASIQNRARQEQKKKEEARKAEIERIEKEKSQTEKINSFLANL